MQSTAKICHFLQNMDQREKKLRMNVAWIVCTIMYTEVQPERLDFVKILAQLFGISNIVPELKLSVLCTISKRWQKTFKTFVKAIK